MPWGQPCPHSSEPHGRYLQLGRAHLLLPWSSNQAPRPDWGQPNCWALLIPSCRSRLSIVPAPPSNEWVPAEPPLSYREAALDAPLPTALQHKAVRGLLRPGKAGAGKHPARDSGFVQALPLGTDRPPGNVPEIFSGSIMEILAQLGSRGQYRL